MGGPLGRKSGMLDVEGKFNLCYVYATINHDNWQKNDSEVRYVLIN